MEIRFLGHACFELEHEGTRVLIDPFLTGNPKAAAQAAEVDPDVILLSHGHGDHLGDTVDIARRTGAPVVAVVELATEIANELGEGHQVFDPNLGGTVEFDWGSVRFTPAWHTSNSPGGSVSIAAGLVIELGGARIYHLGDTALFSDLALPARRAHLNVALIPIGGHYTMDRFDAVAAAELVRADTVIPMHYDTFPPIQTDVQAFKADVEQAGFAEVVVLEPGASYTVKP
jgi:L-ascorbate metabolism protein UlaG (beta-lactamase superfamily)